MQRQVSSAALPLLFALSISPAFSQVITGSIAGSVRDSSGALAAAQLRVVSASTGAERAGQSDDVGDFVVTGLDPGAYSIRVQSAGFKTFERKGVALAASERLSVGVLTLEVALHGRALRPIQDFHNVASFFRIHANIPVLRAFTKGARRVAAFGSVVSLFTDGMLTSASGLLLPFEVVR